MANTPQNTTTVIDQAAGKAAEAARETADRAAKAGRETADRAAEAGRDTFKKAVDSTATAVSEMSAQSKRNMEALADSATAAAEAAQTLSAQATSYAKTAAEEQAAAVRKLFGARTFQEAWEIQASYAKSAFDAHMAETNRFNETFMASTAQAWRPINERVQAVAEQFSFAR